MTFFADVGDSIKAIVSGGRKLDSPGYSGGSSGTGFGAWGGMRFMGSHSPGAGINYAAEAGELRFNSIVAACLQVRYKAISAAPPYLAQKNAEGVWNRVDSHSLQSLLDVPNGFYGRNALWGATDGARCASNAGSGFWRINWLSDHSEPGEILWEANASPVWDEQSFIKEYHVNNGRGVDTYAAAVNFDWQRNRDNKRPCIVQFRYQLDPFNPRNGWSPLQTVLRQIATDNGLSSSLAAVVRNAAQPGWGITADNSGGVDGFVTPAQVEAVVTMLDKIARGEGAGRSIGTNAPVKFDKLTLNPDDVASPKINSFDVERICAVLDVPPLLIGLNTDSNSTYANQEQAGKKFWNSMLLEMDSMGDAIEGQVFPLYRDLNRENFCILWDTSQIEALQESQDAKFTRASTGTNKVAFATQNEARRLVGLPVLTPKDKNYKPEYDEIPGGGGEPEQGADGAQDAAAAKSLGRTFSTHLTQPRDDLGRWTSGSGALNAAHVATVLRSEGVHESRHAEVLSKIASGEHTTREQVLGHIDTIHNEPKVLAPSPAERAIAAVHQGSRTPENIALHDAHVRAQPGENYGQARERVLADASRKRLRSIPLLNADDKAVLNLIPAWRLAAFGGGTLTLNSPREGVDRASIEREYGLSQYEAAPEMHAVGVTEGLNIRLSREATNNTAMHEIAHVLGYNPESSMGNGFDFRAGDGRRPIIEEALKEGRKVPPRLLANYPDLREKHKARKSLETDMQVLDALPAPEPLLDLNDVALSDEEIAALEDTENPESIALAYGRATPAKRAILGAQGSFKP